MFLNYKLQFEEKANFAWPEQFYINPLFKRN